MGFQLSMTGGTAVTISGSVTTSAVTAIPSSEQTLISIPFTGTGSAQTIRTVTAGKTFYLKGIQIYGASASFQVNTSADVLVILFATGAGMSSLVAPSGDCPFCSYAASSNVRVVCTNGANMFAWGIEQ